MSEFQEGDVVYLKSGGPAMTITELSDDRNSYCEWFNKDQELQGGSFKNTSLVKKEGSEAKNQNSNALQGNNEQPYDPLK